MERVMSKWEAMASDNKYSLVKHAIEAGLANLIKWYRKTDETSVYFVAHGVSSTLYHYVCPLRVLLTVLDPVRRDRYITKAWDAKYVKEGMDRMKNIVSFCRNRPKICR
jgi:hypothetical protein